MAKANAPSISALDQEEIRAMVMRGQETWNRHDMKAWAERLTDEADWINIVGMHWRGKAAVLGNHAGSGILFSPVRSKLCGRRWIGGGSDSK
jgi:hypothetical protein